MHISKSASSLSLELSVHMCGRTDRIRLYESGSHAQLHISAQHMWLLRHNMLSGLHSTKQSCCCQQVKLHGVPNCIQFEPDTDHMLLGPSTYTINTVDIQQICHAADAAGIPVHSDC